jgi:hypothetical protein
MSEVFYVILVLAAVSRQRGSQRIGVSGALSWLRASDWVHIRPKMVFRQKVLRGTLRDVRYKCNITVDEGATVTMMCNSREPYETGK